MKILATGDWHEDVVTLGIARSHEIVRAVEHSVDVAIAEKVDAYIFLGDLCDPDSGGSTFLSIEHAAITAARLARANILNIWLRGNHDVVNDGTGASTLSPLKALSHLSEYIVVCEKPSTVVLKEKYTLVALPYPSIEMTVKEMDVIAAKLMGYVPKKDKIIVAGHLMIPGAVVGEETIDLPRGREVLFPIEATSSASLKLNGHYHRRQVTKEGIHIPGSLARLCFGEAEGYDPAFLVLEV